MGALTHNGEVLQGLPANASQINFDKTGTDLSATQTEAAIKEVNGKVNDNADEIDELKSGLTNIGTILDGEHDNDTISVETATITALGSVTLTAGKWLVLGTIDWAANNTGYRQVAFGSGLNPARNGATTTAALSDTGKETYQQVSRIYDVASTETVTVYGYQTSGSALNAMPYIRAIKISA